MSLRPPRLAASRLAPRAAPAATADDDPLARSIDQEILAEKFATLGRLVEKLERALARLEEAEPGSHDRARRSAAVAEAAWHVVVQRDLLRLPGNERFLAEAGVPPALAARIIPPRPGRGRSVNR